MFGTKYDDVPAADFFPFSANHEKEIQIVQPMTQANQLTSIRPAVEVALQWPGQQLKLSREEKHTRLILGIVRLAIIAGLIFGTLAAGV